MNLNRNTRRKIDKILNKKKKNESMQERSERTRENAEKGKKLHLDYLKSQEEEQYRRNNPQVNEE